MLKILAYLLLLSSFTAFAQCNKQSNDCVPVGEWQFSLALGAGIYSNPLHGGKDIPLIAIPYISYYRDNFFFENTTIGYTLIDTPQWNASMLAQLNHEQAFFERWHPNNIFVPVTQTSFTNGEISAENTHKNIDITDVSKRDWAIDAGLLVNWYLNDFTQLSLDLLHDISDVYQGSHVNLTYQYMIIPRRISKSNLTMSGGLSWKSKRLNNYYYGITAKDTDDLSLHYNAKSAFLPFIGLAFQKQLSTQWQFKANVKRVFLPSTLTDSPLIKATFINTFFIGVKYDF